jgi:hypothetical protein
MAVRIPAMSTTTKFSADGRYRYALEHVLDPNLPPRRIMWIGLNPSLSDEIDRDPTLRRIHAFSDRLGYASYVVTNLCAFRAARPREMEAAADPIGPENDATILELARGSEAIVACWGSQGTFRNRGELISLLLEDAGVPRLQSLGKNGDGSPKHPLYVRWDTVLTGYPWPAVR